MARSPYEPQIRAAITSYLTSASHQMEHLEQVVQYALDLAATYGGDVDVLTAAALMHDLGRSNTKVHGVDSVRASVEAASDLLEVIEFPQDKREAVLTAIGEHDQPALKPTTLEARILKDADFLAGFGATGIARAALWTGESGGTMADLIDRLERKMAMRIASLEFPQSRAHAAQTYLFVRLFLDQLRRPQPMRPLPAQPYIVIEGISGSGKSTQAALLRERFAASGKDSLLLHEPTPWYREMRSGLGEARSDRGAQLLLLLTDRYLNVRPEIEAAQAAGQPVISDRSYLSSMVYQGDQADAYRAPANIAHLHALMPQPTHLFVLDVTPETATARIDARESEAGKPRGDHETPDQLRLHREQFRSLDQYFPHLRMIDAETQTPAQIHALIWAAIRDYPSGVSNRPESV